MTIFWVAFIVVGIVEVGFFWAVYKRLQENKKVVNRCDRQKGV